MAEISEKIRVFRKSRRMTLKEVADKAGCTSAYISQLEKGRANPSISTLKKIATVFNVNIVDFFLDANDEQDDVLIRKDQRAVMDLNMGSTLMESLSRTAKDKRMQPFLITVKPGSGSNGEYTHEGEEFGIVLEAELELTVGDKVYHVKKGDSFYFLSTQSHGFHNRGEREVVVIWVTSPPSF